MEQKNSLNNQLEYFKNYIKKNPKWIYITSYIDDGITGTNDLKREQFMKMIFDAKNDKFDLILTKEISRFSRNTLDSIKYTRELLENGVAVFFLNDNINTLLPDAELRLTIMASLAQDEVRRLSERVRFGMQRAIEKKKILGNNSLYGYYKDKKTNKLVINQEEAIIVEQIYKLYTIDKLSLTKIAKYLTDRNIKTSLGYNFTVSSLSRMIENPKYKGYYCGRKTRVVDYMSKRIEYLDKSKWVISADKINIPPIINDELWSLANKRLEKRKANYKRKNSNKKLYLYSGKIYCLNDNSLFYRRYFKQDKKDATWICSKHLKEGRNSCLTLSLRESELNSIFNDLLERLNICEDVVSLLMTKYKEINKRSLTRTKKRKELGNLKEKNDKLLNLYLDNVITKSELTEMINNNKELININKKEEVNINLEEINNELKRLINSKEIQEKIINELLKRITVTSTNNSIKLDIYLKKISDLDEYTIEKEFIRDKKQLIYLVTHHFD